MNQKTALVVGASSGLGKEVAIALSERGFKTYVASRNILETNLSLDIERVVCDVTDATSVQTMYETVLSKKKTLDVVVYCVGTSLVSPFESTSFQEIDEIMATNVSGALYVALQGYKLMKPQAKGHIVLVGSTSSIHARANEVVYCASKWGLRGLAQSLAVEAKKHGIRVTGIYPGGMKTNFWNKYPEKSIEGYMDPRNVAKQIVSAIETDDSLLVSEIVIERA